MTTKKRSIFGQSKRMNKVEFQILCYNWEDFLEFFAPFCSNYLKLQNSQDSFGPVCDLECCLEGKRFYSEPLMKQMRDVCSRVWKHHHLSPRLPKGRSLGCVSVAFEWLCDFYTYIFHDIGLVLGFLDKEDFSWYKVKIKLESSKLPWQVWHWASKLCPSQLLGFAFLFQICVIGLDSA